MTRCLVHSPRALLPCALALAAIGFASSARAQDGGTDAGPPSTETPDAGPAEPGAQEADAEPVEADPIEDDTAEADAIEDDTDPATTDGEAIEADTPPSDATDVDGTEADAGDADGSAGAATDDDLFPEDGDLEALLEGEEDLAIPDVVVRAPAEPEPVHDTGGAVYRVDEELLERFNYDDPNTVLLQVPGVYVRQEDGYGLRPNIGLRGVDANRSTRITLLEDGVLFSPAAYAAPAAYYFPLMTRMTGVDVYMGAATIPYGPRTVGGAIDLRNREIPRELDGGLDLALGTTWLGRAHGHVGTSNDWGGFLVEGVYLHSDGFKHIGDPEGENAGQSTGFDRGEILLRGQLHGALTDDIYHRLELRLGFSGEVSNETYLGLTDEDFQTDPYLRYEATRLDRMAWWRTQAQLRHTLEWGDDFTLRTVAYRHDLQRDWNKLNAMGSLPTTVGSQARVGPYDVLTNPTTPANQLRLAVLRGAQDTTGTASDYLLIGNNGRRFANTGIQTDAVGRAETGPFRHQIRGGLRLHHDAVDRHHTEDAYAMTSGELVRATDESYTTLQNRAEALAFSAYVAWAVSWETLTLTPGVRTEVIWNDYEEEGVGASADVRAAVLPGASLEWAIVPEVRVFGGVMRGFSPVAPGQAAEVQPEESVTYEAGVRVIHEESRTTGQLTGFVNDYSNFLQQCSFAAGCAEMSIDEQANGGEAIIAGFDARVSTDLRIDEVKLPLRASYTFTYTELQSTIENAPNPQFLGGQPGSHLPYIPEHQLSVQAGLEMRQFGINVAASYVGAMWEAVRREDDRPPPRTDDAFLLDATAYVQVWEGVKLYVRGENLTLTQNITARHPMGARPGRPFLLQGGVRLDL